MLLPHLRPRNIAPSHHGGIFAGTSIHLITKPSSQMRSLCPGGTSRTGRVGKHGFESIALDKACACLWSRPRAFPFRSCRGILGNIGCNFHAAVAPVYARKRSSAAPLRLIFLGLESPPCGRTYLGNFGLQSSTKAFHAWYPDASPKSAWL